ncbi:MAG: methylenetetrahydrofolate reductase C-terminal domain-containing protein [Candidatus Ratteibacteria bacterium]
MLITKLKKISEIESYFYHNTFVIKCFGCKEVYFPEEEIDVFLQKRTEHITAIARLDYLCNEEFSRDYISKYLTDIERADTVIVFSCGVGVQVVARIVEGKKVLTGCDTSYINGFQGLTAQPYDCRQCGECYLNYTGGICPITACSKHLLNGPCGGYKNGKCEVNPEMDCGWCLIYKRLSLQKKENKFITDCRIRNYQRYIIEPQKDTLDATQVNQNTETQKQK